MANKKIEMKISTIHKQALDEFVVEVLPIRRRSNSSSQLLHFTMKYEVTNAHPWSIEGVKAKEKEKKGTDGRKNI